MDQINEQRRLERMEREKRREKSKPRQQRYAPADAETEETPKPSLKKERVKSIPR